MTRLRGTRPTTPPTLRGFGYLPATVGFDGLFHARADTVPTGIPATPGTRRPRPLKPRQRHEYRVTFPDVYRHVPHPVLGVWNPAGVLLPVYTLPDGWVTVVAHDYRCAHSTAARWLGTAHGVIYTPYDVTDIGADQWSRRYPGGEITRVHAGPCPDLP